MDSADRRAQLRLVERSYALPPDRLSKPLPHQPRRRVRRIFTYIALTCAYANLDRMEEAKTMLKRIRELSPHLTIKLIIDGAAKYDAFADAVVPPLRRVGLPER